MPSISKKSKNYKLGMLVQFCECEDVSIIIHVSKKEIEVMWADTHEKIWYEMPEYMEYINIIT